MFFTIIIAFFSLIALVIIHEFGHFILAKKFGAKIEEFGIGYPPRIIGKKINQTLYSLNILPFGAFVKIYGEEGGAENYRSFIGKPIWQRVLIVLGGVVSFWFVSIILLSIVAGVWGLPTAVSDKDRENLKDPKVQIIQIAADSPAHVAELKVGDIITGFETVKDVQEFISARQGKEAVLTIKRGSEVFERTIVPRVLPPEGEGPLGVSLTRIALKSYPWYQAPLQGVFASANLTSNIVNGWILGLKSALGLVQLPQGVKMEMMGPLGIFGLLSEYFSMGINYFLFLVSLIAVGLALANILPIPALDGGKLIFLSVEWLRGKPINYKIEQRVSAVFFVLLIILMIFVTVKFDIPRIF